MQTSVETKRSQLSLPILFVLSFNLWITHAHAYTSADSIQLCQDQHQLCKTSNSVHQCLLKHLYSQHPVRETTDYAEPKHTCDDKEDSDFQKSDHLPWAVPLGLPEFKSRAISSKIKTVTGSSGTVMLRVEPGGAEYNFASASKGAKVLASNKEAKGASNILNRDKDKYLRNPCSAEDKFVIIELSEQTLVDTIEIANFEHHSSNLKQFELHGSLSFPTDFWVFLGNFTASNVRHAQRFVFQEPKWVRYLKLNLQSHYGSEFYCTLSVVEVYGVDAVERMLEDLINTQDNLYVPEEGNADKRTASPRPNPNPVESENDHQSTSGGVNSDPASHTPSANHDMVNGNVPDPVEEIRQQAGRIPGDTVLKILMQKVRSLDLNLFVLERYMEDLNSRYFNILKEHSKDIGEKDLLIQNIEEGIRNLIDQHDVITNDASDLKSWKSRISMQLDHLLRDNAVLRSEIDEVRRKQASLESKSIVLLLVCCIFTLLVILRIFLDMLTSVYRILRVDRTDYSRKFCAVSSSWFLLLLNCIIIMFILTM